MENKDIQDEKYKDWILNTKEIEQKAISVGVDPEMIKRIERKQQIESNDFQSEI